MPTVRARPNNNNQGALAVGGGLLNLTAATLRLLLWPVRFIFTFLFPFGDTDGLSTTVTEKAAQQFVAYLRTVVGTPASSSWSTSGFAAVKQEALANQALVLLYLHSPLHHHSRAFCEEILAQEPIVSWIQQNDRVIATGVSIHTGQGAHLQQQLGIDAFPALAVLQPGTGNTLRLICKAEGLHTCRTQLLPRLHVLQQEHQAAVIAQETDRLRRQQDEQLRIDQDAEYQATLAADRERARRQAEEREATLAKEAAERKEQEEAAQALQRCRDLVLPEPPTGTSNTAMIRFCLPTGAKLNRRFTATQTIASLKAFVHVHCVDNNIPLSANLGLSTNFPRKTYEDDTVTVEAAALMPQAVIMVQDLDA